MAQFRRNHTPQGRGLQTSFRIVVLLIIAIICFALGFGWIRNKLSALSLPTASHQMDGSNRTFLPHSPYEVVHHTHYSLGYSERHEQAAWVAYLLESRTLRVKNVARTNEFLPDPLLHTGSAVHADYSRSGYTRGHLAPAGDMAFDGVAMKESFYMSNMSPQQKEFNNGVWKELEMQVRNWAKDNEALYIVTGPVLNDSLGTIGRDNSVTVPRSFYKVILDYTGEERKGVAFLIPHARSEEPLGSYMLPIDSIEAITGIDFFRNMINNQEEEALENRFNPDDWTFDPELFRRRIEEWNRQ